MTRTVIHLILSDEDMRKWFNALCDGGIMVYSFEKRYSENKDMTYYEFRDDDHVFDNDFLPF